MDGLKNKRETDSKEMLSVVYIIKMKCQFRVGMKKRLKAVKNYYNIILLTNFEFNLYLF